MTDKEWIKLKLEYIISTVDICQGLSESILNKSISPELVDQFQEDNINRLKLIKLKLYNILEID